MLRALVKILLLTEAIGVATFALGWWGVPLVCLIWALLADPRGKPVRFATISAVMAWGILLLLDAARGPVGEVAVRFGGVIGIRPLILFGITLLFPALLAWSASSVGASIRLAWSTRRPETAERTDEPAATPPQREIAIVDA